MDATVVGAVVTAFYPDGLLNHLIEELARQTSHIVVVDNTPANAHTAYDPLPLNNVQYIRTGRNHGLAAALNRGVRQLLKFSLSHISFWDQDSTPPPDYIGNVLTKSRSFAEWPRIIVSGCHADTSGTIMSGVSKASDRPAWLITSGMIVPVAILRSIGPFREEFFVDAVDIDFSLRARAQGVALYLLHDLTIRHRFGDPSRSRKPLFFHAKTSGHPTWRQYWIARNQAILVCEYQHIDTEAINLIKKYQMRWFIRNFLAGPERLRLMNAIIAGRRDARKGRITGRYDPRTI